MVFHSKFNEDVRLEKSLSSLPAIITDLDSSTSFIVVEVNFSFALRNASQAFPEYIPEIPQLVVTSFREIATSIRASSICSSM
ncbi:MAG TPA: hypothetical protein VEL11_13530 [Candidatus Bathyarchaeia archaeon]|nr:hypothetical protein [Candidatus Bathyarchaeia archaeon]